MSSKGLSEKVGGKKSLFVSKKEREYAKNFGLSGEQVKALRKADLPSSLFDTFKKDLKSEFEKRKEYLVPVTFSICRILVERGNTWKEFMNGPIFLCEGVDNIQLAMMGLFSGVSKELHRVSFFSQAHEQIAVFKEVDDDHSTLILYTPTVNYIIFFPKLYPRGKFMNIFRDLENKKKEIRSPKKDKTPKKISNVESKVSQIISDKVKFSSQPPKLGAIRTNSIDVTDATSFMTEVGNMEEWKKYMTQALKIDLSLKKLGKVRQFKNALRKYKEYQLFFSSLQSDSPSPPEVGTRNDVKFQEFWKEEENSSILDLAGGGF